MSEAKPKVLVLGGNFSGLGAAQKIRDYAGDGIDIAVVDRKAYLDYIPNIPLEAGGGLYRRVGGGNAFYIHPTSWFGGDIQELRMGRLPYAQKLAYKEMFFRNHGRVPNWGLPLAEWSAEHIAI